MFVKLIAILLILIGIAGLILPILPGMLLITIGILLLYRERHEEINRYINKRAPRILVNLYNNFIHKIILPPHYVGVDWDWVRKELISGERMDKVLPELDETIRKARSLTDTRYTSVEKKVVGIGDDFIEIEGGIKLYTKKITSYIKGAGSVVFFLVTIGDEIEKEASELTSGKDPLEGYLLDRIGSFAVESIAENMEKRLRKNYHLVKKSVSSRFSPGYCDWAVEEQFKIAKILDFSKIGVGLTEGCMMVPKKSISAMVAIADEGVFKEFVSSCTICEKTDCGYRRA